MIPKYHIAQFNIAKPLAELDSERMSDFMNGVAAMNAPAEKSPGFIWRLMTAAGDATDFQPYNDNTVINLSVWSDIVSLKKYAYKSAHAEFFRRRREWFHKTPEATLVLWWVEAGATPDLSMAVAKLDPLRKHGPGPAAFTFKTTFATPSA